MNQIPNIEETNTREVEDWKEEFFSQEDEFGYSVDTAASGGDLNNKDYVRKFLTPKLHQQLQKAREELIQEIYDEFNWLNTNNAIPDSEIGKGDLHWEMLQKISSDTRRELQARLIKVATEHNVTLNAYHHQSELDQPNK